MSKEIKQVQAQIGGTRHRKSPLHERKPRPCGRQRLSCTRSAGKPRSIGRASQPSHEGTRPKGNFRKPRETRGFDLPPS